MRPLAGALHLPAGSTFLQVDQPSINLQESSEESADERELKKAQAAQCCANLQGVPKAKRKVTHLFLGASGQDLTSSAQHRTSSDRLMCEHSGTAEEEASAAAGCHMRLRGCLGEEGDMQSRMSGSAVYLIECRCHTLPACSCVDGSLSESDGCG